MAVQITTGWPSCVSGRFGPFRDGSGNLWLIAKPTGGSSNYPTAYKSTDDGATWNTSYSETNPDASLYKTADSLYDGNDAIYVACIGTQNLGVFKFTISTHTWSEVYTSGTRPIPYAGTWPVFLARRSDGNFVVAYQGSANAMGQPYRRVYYALLSSTGVWSAIGTEVETFSKGNNYDLKEMILGAGDRIHFFFGRSTTLFLRTLTSSNNWTEAEQGMGALLVASDYIKVIWDAILTKIIYGLNPDVGDAWKVCRAPSQNTGPVWTIDTNSVGYSEPASSPPALVYEPINNKLYVFYRDSVSDDLYQNSTDSTTWDTGAAAQQDAGTIAGISVNPIYEVAPVSLDDASIYASLPIGVDTTANERQAQSFSFATDCTIKKMALWLAETAGPTDNLIVEIQSDSAGSPSGTVLATIATIAGTSLTTTAAVYSWDANFAASAGTTYWLVLRRSGAVGGAYYLTYNSYKVLSGVEKVYKNGAWETHTSGLDMAIGLYPTATAIGIVYNDSGTVYFDTIVLEAEEPITPVTANEEFFALL